MKAKITYLGGPETGDVGRTTWGNYEFELNKPVEITDPHIIEKAKGNKFFKVEMMADTAKPAATPAPAVDDDDDDDDAPSKQQHPAGRSPSRSR